MKKLSPLLALLTGFAAALPAQAATSANGQPVTSVDYNSYNNTSYKTPSAAMSSNASPDTINAAFGGYDFDKDGSDRQSIDYRLEYQWGASLIPMMNPAWGSSDQWFQLHPVAGFEGNGNGMTYFNGGLNLDVPLFSTPLIFTWGESIGWYGHGDDKQALDSAFEMRSQLELGWEFDNKMRLSAYISHLSNAGTGDVNPGAEILGGYLRIPVGWLAK